LLIIIVVGTGMEKKSISGRNISNPQHRLIITRKFSYNFARKNKSNKCCGSGSTCFWPPGSGSTSQRYSSGSGSGSGSGSFYHHAKIVRKTMIPNIL
jgi:hypothetical protein